MLFSVIKVGGFASSVFTFRLDKVAIVVIQVDAVTRGGTMVCKPFLGL